MGVTQTQGELGELPVFIDGARGKLEKLVQAVAVELALGAGVHQNLVCHVLLEDLAVIDLFFYSVVDQEAVDYDVPLLADSKCSVCSLNVDHGVPIRIEDDYLVCTLKVDAQAADFGGEEEDEHRRIGVEVRDQCLALRHRHLAIEAQVAVPLPVRQLLKDVKHLLGLAEHQYFVRFLVNSYQASILFAPLLKKVEEHSGLGGHFPVIRREARQVFLA